MLLREGAGAYVPAATWPAGQSPAPSLLAVAERVLMEGRGRVLSPAEREAGKPVPLDGAIVAEPVSLAGVRAGAVVLEVTPRPEAELSAVAQILRFGQGWLRGSPGFSFEARRGAPVERLETILALLAAALEQERFSGAVRAFATELATLLGCERTSVGFRRRGRVRLHALSHSSDFGERTNLVRSIEAAMDEALDQRSSLVLPARDGLHPRGTHAHAELARMFGATSICTVPLVHAGDACGAITLERVLGPPFDAESLALLEAMAAVVGPSLELLRREDRSIVAKVAQSLRAATQALWSTHAVVAKLVACIGVLLLGALVFAEGEYRVTSDAVLEPLVKRASAVPFDGFIARAPARAGDRVAEGQLLAALDDRDLRLERLKWESEQAQQAKQYRKALSERDAPQAAIYAAALSEATAELRRLDDRLARTALRAPFDGVVVSGDLTQRLGAPVQKGDVLFEIAPLESWRLHVKVDERDVSDIQLGQSGTLALSSLPRESFPIVVRKVTPVSTPEEGGNYFRVEASLEDTPSSLLPGTQGIAKIEVGRRRWLWIWTHRATDWIRLKLWAWLP